MAISLVAGLGIKFFNKISYTPIYQTSVRIRINSVKNDNELEFDASITAMNQIISDTYLSLAKSKYTLNEIKKLINTDLSPDEIGSKYSLTADEDNSEFITINVKDTDPKRAVQIANTIPHAFNKDLIRTIYLDCVEVVDEAVEPTSALPAPVSSAHKIMLIVGVVIAIFVVLLLEFLDNKIVTPKDVEEHWDIPLLGIVPYEKTLKEETLEEEIKRKEKEEKKDRKRREKKEKQRRKRKRKARKERKRKAKEERKRKLIKARKESKAIRRKARKEIKEIRRKAKKEIKRNAKKAEAK